MMMKKGEAGRKRQLMLLGAHQQVAVRYIKERLENPPERTRFGPLPEHLAG